ncbi:MAG: hypothetical protein ABIR18_14760 [Chitinophagaceae bacterium]
MKRIVLLSALVASLFFIASCKKGDDGEPGTANVKYSEWFTPTPYIKDTVFGVWGFKYIKAVPEITQEILDKGTVLVFAKLIGYNSLIWPAGQVGQLPINVTYIQSGVTTDNWAATANVGNIKIRFTNDRNIYTSIASTHQFRYVIIPGGVPMGRGISLNYEDICKMYNIPE